ncbi:hypothetical protein [Haloferula rosea]|uniref:TPM domain-containing protein n=1 Tax=Haloferula rosea TaxID=490093 RepID=A0A934VEB9_9BACT|nr:hypothetical protein [Haloferula rosea]MBK1827149.1 hypothetical protein [Haloferula rosea]
MRVCCVAAILSLASLAGAEEFGPSLPEEGLGLPGVAIPADCWPDYFGGPAEDDLVDPQGLLNSRERKDREEFLRYHADDSRIRLRAMIFDHDQRFPSDMERHLEPWLSSGEPTALLLYRMGEPARAELHFSSDLAQEVPRVEVGRLIGQAARAAQEEVGDLDQFKEFCLQVSIRLYWIERSLGWVEEPADTIPVAEPEPIEEASGSELIKEAVRGAWDAGGLPFLVALSSFISFAVLRFIIRSRRRYRFPEFEMDPRLGGAHGAGVGAVISFGSTTQSPSAQKSPTVDCLGGI